MGNDEFTWSKKEKETAKIIFDMAYQKEISQIKDKAIKLLSKYKGPKDIWILHDYLSKIREETNLKYDYRYSVIIKVFACLFEDGLISEDDMKSLSEEKINRIKEMAEYRKTILRKNR
jgi:hypothetical protein